MAELREVIHTSYLFDGYPTALEGYKILSPLTGTEVVDATEFRYSPENIQLWRERGRNLCKDIYGPQYGPLMERITDLTPELHEAMIIEGYGKVLSREDLDTMSRELCIISILASKGRLRQLLSHTIGARRLGAYPVHIQTAIEEARPYMRESDIPQVDQVVSTALSKHIMP